MEFNIGAVFSSSHSNFDLSSETDIIQAIFGRNASKARQLIQESPAVALIEDRNKRSPVHAAAYCGEPEIIDMLILSGAGKDKKDSNWQTPLHLACVSQKTSALEMLLQHHVDLRVRDRYYQIPLHLAAAHNAVHCAELLISTVSDVTHLDISDKFGRTALHYAAAFGHAQLVDLLLRNKANVTVMDKEQRTPLLYATQKGHLVIIKSLIASNASLISRDKQGWNCIHLAASGGHQEIMTLLLHHQQSTDTSSSLSDLVNVTTNDGDTALHIACNNGRIDVVKLLLMSGANINSMNNRGLAPIHLAASSSEGSTCMEFLLENKADFDIMCHFKRTPLHYVASVGRNLPVLVLLDAKARVDVRDRVGMTPLHIAAMNGHERVIERLAAAMTNLDLRSIHGITALHLAALSGHRDPVQCLLHKPINVQIRDDNGRNALHYLALCQEPNTTAEVAKLLVNAGVVFCSDDRSRTPLHYACMSVNVELTSFLVRHFHTVCDVNEVDCFLKTPLMYALAYSTTNDNDTNNSLLVQYLLTEKSNLDRCDQSGMNALHYACIVDHNQFIIMMCDMRKEYLTKLCVSRTHKQGFTPLHVAAWYGASHALVNLLEHCNNILDIDLLDKQGRSPLMLACLNSQAEAVKVLVVAGHSLNSIPGQTMNLFHVCASRGNYGCLQQLMTNFQGTDSELIELLNEVDVHGRTPVMLAASQGHAECVKYLLTNDANQTCVDANGRTLLHRLVASELLLSFDNLSAKSVAELLFASDTNGKNALHLAVRCKNLALVTAVVHLISEHGVAAEISDSLLADADGFTPLHFACLDGQFQMVELLLNNPVTSRWPKQNHCTPLHCAAMAGDRSSLTFLLTDNKTTALINQPDDEGRTPLHLACICGHSDCVELLQQNKADVNVCDKAQLSPLMTAAERGYRKIIPMLLEKNADQALCDHANNTALHYACYGRYEMCATMLIDAAPSVDILNMQNARLKTPMHIAARNGLFDVVCRLLSKKVRLDIPDNNDLIASLACAVNTDAADCLSLLINAQYECGYEAYAPGADGDSQAIKKPKSSTSSVSGILSNRVSGRLKNLKARDSDASVASAAASAYSSDSETF